MKYHDMSYRGQQLNAVCAMRFDEIGAEQCANFDACYCIDAPDYMPAGHMDYIGTEHTRGEPFVTSKRIYR